MAEYKKHTKRIFTDIAGYLLVVAAILTGWLPGPGGVPLLIAGLGLLSINNKWAKDIREYVLNNTGKSVEKLFPKHPIAQWAYDLVAITLFAVSAYLAWSHAAYWQVMLASSAFFIAVFISLMNRDRLERFRNRKK